MSLEPILQRSFAQADRAEVQKRIAQQVERDPEPFLARYVRDPRSLRGRYVNSDLMKETFDEYKASKASRNRYNAPVHNTAAVLSAEQYRRVVHSATESGRNAAMFLTGIPGAGKTTYVLGAGGLPSNVHVLYEGQLADPSHAIPKIAEAIDAALLPSITVVHASTEQALQNTLYRFETEGRGASIEAMASIQGGLSAGLRAIHERFGDMVELYIVDRRGKIGSELHGWKYLPELESEGGYEHVKRSLADILERALHAGRISQEAYEQAVGKAPRDIPS